MQRGRNNIYKFTIISNLARINEAFLDISGNPKAIKALNQNPEILKKIKLLSEETRKVCKELYDSIDLFTGFDKEGKPQVESIPLPTVEEEEDSEEIIAKLVKNTENQGL